MEFKWKGPQRRTPWTAGLLGKKWQSSQLQHSYSMNLLLSCSRQRIEVALPAPKLWWSSSALSRNDQQPHWWNRTSRVALTWRQCHHCWRRRGDEQRGISDTPPQSPPKLSLSRSWNLYSKQQTRHVKRRRRKKKHYKFVWWWMEALLYGCINLDQW